MLSNSVMSQIRQHAENRKKKLAVQYANIAKGPGESPALQAAANAGINQAVEKLHAGGISHLNTLIDQHETTDKLWQTALRTGGKVTLADRPVKIGQLVQHGIELREMKLMMKFARRMANIEARQQAAKREVDSNIVRWMHRSTKTPVVS